MRRLRTHRTVAAPAERLWELLVSVDRWPEWGPTVRGASIEGDRVAPGATGTVETVLGVTLPFEITDFGEGRHWSWRVGGIPATDHTVHALGSEQCRVGFGVPWPAAPYLAVCEIALRRLERLALAGP